MKVTARWEKKHIHFGKSSDCTPSARVLPSPFVEPPSRSPLQPLQGKSSDVSNRRRSPDFSWTMARRWRHEGSRMRLRWETSTPLFLVGRVPLLKWTTEKKRVLTCSNLSTGGPSHCWLAVFGLFCSSDFSGAANKHSCCYKPRALTRDERTFRWGGRAGQKVSWFHILLEGAFRFQVKVFPGGGQITKSF